jgi:ABC-type nitrate/sulfonate/bicarbonate transport system substrate-binding protein
MSPITVALDWTPNTNHVGFYVAKAKGWYGDAGLEVTLLSPHHDGYKATPASRVADGSASFAVTPTESVVSSHTLPSHRVAKPRLVAVAALQARSTSAVVTLKASGRDTPGKLDGCNYASYGARYEGRIVQQLIKNGGGTGDYTESVPDMLGIWNTLLAGKADATWVFLGATRRPAR